MIVKEREMQSITFQSKSLKVVESAEHTFLMATKDVASGYGVTEKTIRDHKLRQSDELIEGKHFIIDFSYNNTPKTYWTKRGIVRLGFFIKSERAKQFRDWAEDYAIDGQNADNDLKQIIMQQNETIAQLSKKIGEGTVFSAMEYNFIFELIGQVSRNIQEDETMELILRKRRTIMQNFLRGLVSSTKNKGILEQAKRESNEVYFHALRSQEECFGCMVSNKPCGSAPAPVKKRGT